MVGREAAGGCVSDGESVCCRSAGTSALRVYF